MQRLSRPLIKTDINRASRLFFRHCKVNKSNSICKIIRSYLVHFYTNETFCTPKTNIFTKKTADNTTFWILLYNLDLIQAAPVLSGKIYFAIGRVIGNAIQDICIRGPELVRKQTGTVNDASDCTI